MPPASPLPLPSTWWLYLLLCAHDRLYVGIAKDVELRFEAHRLGKGAFYTRLNAPVRILARQSDQSQVRQRACRRLQCGRERGEPQRRVSAGQADSADAVVAQDRDGGDRRGRERRRERLSR